MVRNCTMLARRVEKAKKLQERDQLGSAKGGFDRWDATRKYRRFGPSPRPGAIEPHSR